MKFHSYKFLFMIAVLALTFSCKKKQQTQQAAPPEIPVVEVLQKSVPIYQEFVGQIYGEYDIPIRARVSGFLEGIHFQEGRRVTKGQLLYSIDPQPFEAEVAKQMSALAEAKTSLVKAESDLARYKPLAEINAVAKSDLDAAQAQYDASLAYVDAAKAGLEIAKINLSYCKMYAPITGIIGKTKAKVGEFVGQNPNPVILNTVSKIDNVRVEFFLSESDYLIIAREMMESIKEIQEEEKKGQAALELILADGSVFDQKGYVDFIDREVDPSTGAILIQATFPNPDRLLRPGAFARVKAIMRNAENALLVPQKCVTELQGKFSVYTIGPDNKIQFKAVEVGEKVGDMWLITEGIEPDDKVVLEGIQQIRDGMTVAPVLTEFKSESPLINK